MPVQQIKHNNDGKFYHIAIDIAKEGAQLFDLTPYVKGRVGDNNFGLLVDWYRQGMLMNVNGAYKPVIDGLVGNFSFDKNSNLKMDDDASPVYSVGKPEDCGPAGQVTYYFPEQMFPKEGIFKGYLGLIDDKGNRYSGVDIWFSVLAGNARMGIACDYYISELEKAIKEAEDDLANHKKSMQQIVDEFVSKMNDLTNRLETQANTDQTALDTLEAKIKQDGLFTQAEADAFKQSVMADLENLELHVYDTTADLQAADLKKGQTARTLGDYALNDGGGATYKITDSPSGYHVDLKNSLKAEKINTDDSNYYDEIKQTTKRINGTDVYFVDIPKLDKNGQPITPYIAQNGADRYFDAATKEGGYHDSPTGRNETPTEYARSEHTTLTVNGSASVMVADNTYVNGNIIGNGKILNTWLDQPSSVHVPANFVYVGIMKDRSLREFPFGTSAQQMLDAGVQNSWLSYWRLIRDGAIVDNSQSKSNEGHTKVNDLNPHLGLGIKEDGTLVIAACDGRTDTNPGLTSDDFAEVMKSWGCIDAWHMDGGGSTSVTLRGSKINRNIDNGGIGDRSIPYTFNIKKPGAGGGTTDAYSQAGKVQQETIRQIMPEVEYLDKHTAKWFGQFSFKSDDELDKWLTDELPNLINWTDYPAGAEIMGVITTQYSNSAPAKQIGVTSSVDWRFSFSMSGSHNYGNLVLRRMGDDSPAVIRNYSRNGNPQWTAWYGKDVSHIINPTVIDQIATGTTIIKFQSVIEVNFKAVVTEEENWAPLVYPLPRPISNSTQPIQIHGMMHNELGQLMVDSGGKVLFKGKPDTYQTHFVYLANVVD